MNILTEASKLQNNRCLTCNEEVLNFEEAIENIVSMQDQKHIKYLCYGFYDKTKDSEVMFGLVHAIESYDKLCGIEKSLQELADSIPSMLPNAKEWAITLHKRVLNDSSCLKAYKSVIDKCSIDTKEIIINLINDIKMDSQQRFKDSIDELLS